MKDPAERSKPDKLGRSAVGPWRIPFRGWVDVLRRVWQSSIDDRLGILAAGVAFYLFLSIFPALATYVSIYGLVVSADEAVSQVGRLTSAMPVDVGDFFRGSASEIVDRSESELGWSVGISAVLGLLSARKGAKALFDGIGVAYHEPERRGFLRKNLETLMVTGALIVGGTLVIGLLAVLPLVAGLLGVPDWVGDWFGWLRWPLLALMIMGFLAWVYRVAPDRRKARWRWISPGSIMATLLWLGGSSVLSWYFGQVGDLSRTFGTFGAVGVLMLWLLLTGFVVLLGAELNAELEHQVEADSTVPPEQPLGRRGAWVADHVADRSGGGDGDRHP